MYYLSEITNSKVGSTLYLPTEDYIGYLGWDKAEKEKTGIFVEELPINEYGVGTLCADLDTKKVWYEISIEQLKQAKHTEISKACEQTIFNGIDVNNEHFSLTYNDQINLSSIYEIINQGAETTLYHADGELCRVFTAEEVINLMTTATEFKTYNTTYCNHLFAWIDRCETAVEVNAITYGMALPEDLQNHLNEVLGIETTD